MTPDQVKAARVLLGWSIERLAAYSGMSIHAVSARHKISELTIKCIPLILRNIQRKVSAVIL